MDLDHSSCWDAILEKVRPHIPTINFDSSSSENEEIITIYQRPDGLSLKLPEDFDSFSLDDDELEELLTPATQTEEVWKLDDDDDDDDDDVEACESGSVALSRAKLDVKPNNTKSDEGFPVLSFEMLDQWDLDDILQTLKVEGPSLQQCVSDEPVKTHADGDKDRSQENIMERLVAFCQSQSYKSVSDPVKSPRQNNVWNKSWERMELQLSHQECPTVYIDLRCPDPSIKPPRTSPKLSSESKSPAKETPPAEKLNLKVHSGSQMGDREVTGKSMLLQKIREMRRNGNKCPSERTDPPCSEQGHEAEEQCRHPKMETTQQSTIQEAKQQSDRSEQQHEQHQRILKQLEMHRPTKSVNQKQPAAERTDVLYDAEASHLQSIRALPADIESKGCMLLIVSLSSPGVLGGRGRTKHLYPAATRSHIYNTLVAWFLSLVDPRNDEDEGGAQVPFRVAGLQQLWTERGLALHVLAVARRCYTPTKRDADVHAPFYKHVCRFLSETTLSEIARWLPQLMLHPQACPSPIHLPSSPLNCFISSTSNKKVIDRTFGLSPGFYWQTVETVECVCKGRDATQELHTEVSVALGCTSFFQHPLVTHYTLQLVLHSGLDVCGLRLLYPPQEVLNDRAGAGSVLQRTDETWQPVLALAVRGPHALSVLKDLTRSLEPLLNRKTDPTSLKPLNSRSQDRPLLSSPRLASQVHRELCLWFSGRIQEGSHSGPLNSVRGSLFKSSRSLSFLCATTKADLLLVVSPAVPPRCYGEVLALCERRGFGLRGVQRLQLQSAGATILGLSNQQALVFCSPHVTPDQKEPPSHCLMLLLRKENALQHSVSLPAALMRELKAPKLLDSIRSRLDGAHTAEPSLCFHTVPCSSNLYNHFVGRMWAVPDPSGVILSHQTWSSNCDREQLVILTLTGKDVSQGLSVLHRALAEEPEGDVRHGGFELLGLKRLPALTRLQAHELSPYEVGERLCQDSVDRLMSSSVLVCALRRVNAFASLRKLLPHDYPGDLSVLMSHTPEVAFRQASLFFFEHEITSDPQMQITVCLFKPRMWTHALAQTRKLQLSGLTLVGLRVVTLDKSSAASLLPAESEPSDVEAHVKCWCSGSLLALCLQGEEAVRRLLDVLDRDHGTYVSGSYQRAIQDVRRFFPEGLCCTETSSMRQEQILSVCSDPLASVEREQSRTLGPVLKGSLSPSVAPEPNGGSLIHSALWQTTCLLIPLNAPPLSQAPAQLDLLEQLLRPGCHLVAGRMSTLDNEQREHIAGILSTGENERTTHLYTAPCLILALQGETIVTRFNLILQSIYNRRPDLEKVGETIMYPESEKEAEQLICYLFDALSPESCRTIELHH